MGGPLHGSSMASQKLQREGLQALWRDLQPGNIFQKLAIDLSCRELRSEYQRLELPGTPKVLELLVRLRQHALWAALPLSELQRECRQLGADVVSQDEALRRLTASWLPPEEMPDFWKSQQGKEAVGPKDPKLPALQRVARHFQTLGLSATATPEELKRTYRRLLLQYHPDKNQDMPQDVANQKFREISEAHEAIVEFMKMEN
eukprot:symbB.v1.2.036609.t1/scaffold5205.1/size29850/1